MWRYVQFSQVFLLFGFATRVLTKNLLDDANKITREQVYIDIFKNITHMNDILKELLNNYKQVKAIYENKANLENVLSSEIEHGVIKSSFSIHDNKDQRNKKSRIYVSDEDFHPVTQMILLDEENEASTDDQSDNDQTGTKYKGFSDNVIENLNEIVSSSNIDTHEEDKRKDKVPTVPEMIIIGTGIQPINENWNTKNDNRIKAKLSNKYNLEPYGIQEPNKNIKSYLRTTFDNNYTPRDKMSFETQLEKFKKPKVWKPYQHFPYTLFATKKPARKGPMRKTVVVIVINKNAKQADNQHNFGMLKEDMLRTDKKALRDEYGDACLTVAIRKCYKTLKSVQSIVCDLDFKCKSSFKESFKSYAKTGCVAEFKYNGNSNNTNKWNRRGSKDRNDVKIELKSSDDDIFNDIRRGGPNESYLDLCLPVMITKIKKQEYIKDFKVQPASELKPTSVNILRDDYERQCKKASTERCIRACSFAFDKTCSEHMCVKAQKNGYRKSCNSECKDAFDAPKSKSDSSDSDSSDSDSTNKESDSSF